ncbi:MAG: DUF1214 domain-containing protein [Xanthobacteraceae bacterium]|nr:DUF1214 domain-containing protein [Xanthobacteraceae bacterium]QYK45793.1 MAG: DUF1214 domain-containing protein [Xanthobacteraceae bacterium]
MRALVFIVVLAIGSASGLGLTWLLSGRDNGFGAVRIGAWQAWPKSGTLEADPYARAIFARSGELPVALAEGIAFSATSDDRGRVLDGRCVTKIKGRFLTARYWTITVYDGRGRLIENPAGRYGFTSAEITFNTDGETEIWLSPRVQPGNWLPTGENQQISVVVRLYDIPSGITARGEGAEMPKITQERCP